MSFKNSELNFRPKGKFNHLGIGYKSKPALFLLWCCLAPGCPKSLVILMAVTMKFSLSLKSCSAHSEQHPGLARAPHVSNQPRSPAFSHLSALCGSVAPKRVTITEMAMEQRQTNDCERSVNIHE